MFKIDLKEILLKTVEGIIGLDSKEHVAGQQNFEKNYQDLILLKKIDGIMRVHEKPRYRLTDPLPYSILSSDTPYDVADEIIARESKFDTDIDSLVRTTGATATQDRTLFAREFRRYIRLNPDEKQPDAIENIRRIAKEVDSIARKVLKMGKHWPYLKRAEPKIFSQWLNESKKAVWYDALTQDGGVDFAEQTAQGFYQEALEKLAPKKLQERAALLRKAKNNAKESKAGKKKPKLPKHLRQNKEASNSAKTELPPPVKSAEDMTSELECILQGIKEEVEVLIVTIVQEKQALEQEDAYLTEVKKENKVVQDGVKHLRRKTSLLLGEKGSALQKLEEQAQCADEYRTPPEIRALILNGKNEEITDLSTISKNSVSAIRKYDGAVNPDLVGYQDTHDARVLALVDQIKEKRKECAVLEGHLSEVQNELERTKDEALQTLRQINNHSKALGRLEEIQADLNIEIAQLHYLLEDLKSKTGLPEIFIQAAQYPPLSELGPWAESNLQDRLIIHPAALKNVAISQYSDPDVIYKALELLADGYWNRKMSGSQSREDARRLQEKFMRELTSLRMTIGQSVSDTNKRMITSYEVMHEGKKVFLDQHLGKGRSYDEKRCLRVYFRWNDDTNTVLVGHLPDHLPCVFD